MKASPTLARAIDQFIDAMAAEKGFSAHTLRAYRRDLAEFAAFAADQDAVTVAE